MIVLMDDMCLLGEKVLSFVIMVDVIVNAIRW